MSHGKAFVHANAHIRAFFEANPKLEEIVSAGLEAEAFFAERDSVSVNFLKPELLEAVYSAFSYWIEYPNQPATDQASTTFQDNIFDGLFGPFVRVIQTYHSGPSYNREQILGKTEIVMRFMIHRHFGEHDPEIPIVDLTVPPPKPRRKSRRAATG